jgi:adenylate cyclase
LTAEIFAAGGTVEKHIGDAIFAVFGFPSAGRIDAANALLCADGTLTLSRGGTANARRQANRQSRSASGVDTRLAVVVDIGSEHSLSFTVIGDTVDTASRLQGLTRSLETPLVVVGALVEAIAATSSADSAALLERLQDQRE